MYLNKEDSIEEIIKTVCSGENISLQHSVLSYEINTYFPEHKLAIEIDELGHTDRDINKEIARQTAIENNLGCKFIRINPDKKNFNVVVEINKIFNHIKESINENLVSIKIILCKNDKTKIQRKEKYLILLFHKYQSVILVKIKNQYLLVLKIIKKGSNSVIKETVLNYCLVCKKNTENKDAKVIKTKSNRLMLT